MGKLNFKKLKPGFYYFYIHYITELICFFVLYRYTLSVPLTWLLFFVYDMLAFAPQSIFGYINDKHPRLVFSLLGLVMLAVALLLQEYTRLTFIGLIILCLGNAFIHVNGAEVTLRTSDGHLSQSAIFVSGGSFGVISGRLLSGIEISWWPLVLLIISAIPISLLAQKYLDSEQRFNPEEIPCKAFKYCNKGRSKYVIIILAVVVVMVRGYMGYGIPTSWNKTTLQTVILFVFMGIGKAAGGILSDLIGIKKVAIVSVVLALPFLLIGDNNMYISLFGVMMFSMTMSVTLAILVSALPKTPGLAFGFTTIGLFLGTVPIFFAKIVNPIVNTVMLSVLTVLCLVCLLTCLRKEEKNGSMV